MKRLLLCLYLILFGGDKLMFAQVVDSAALKKFLFGASTDDSVSRTEPILIFERRIPTDTIPSMLLISSPKRHSVSRTEDGYCIRRQYFDTWPCVGHFRLDKKGRLITTPYKVWGCERGGKP